jgi:Tol biopolymer transport system component
VFATVMLTAGADPKQEAERLLKAAKNTVLVDGNVKGALEQYRHIVNTYGKTDRAVAAQALVGMAECYHKLGDPEARKVYQQLVREYSDQKEFAALAHARLGTSAPAGLTSHRRLANVRVGGVGYGTVSPDGRYFPFTDWNDGDLYLRDIATGATRRLTNVNGLNGDGQFAAQAAFSKDGTQVAYSWSLGKRNELRVIDAAGGTQPRRVFGSEEIQAVWPDDWSSDGKWLAVQVRRQDKTAQIGLVAAQDGSFRQLKSVDWRGASRLFFSPDGRYLAYDLPVNDTDSRRDVYVLAVDASHEITAVAHAANDVVIGWAPDGSAVLFSSDRSGVAGLWRQRLIDGKPQGTPDLIKFQIEGAPLGIGRRGELYSLVHPPRFNSAVSANIQLGAFDFDGGRFLKPPAPPALPFVGTNSIPTWSPDGKYLAYVSSRPGPTSTAPGSTDRYVIGIRSSETGQVRELRPALNPYPPFIRWSADGRSLLSHGKDLKGREGVFRIDALTGAASTIVSGTDGDVIRWPSESTDGTRLYYIRGAAGQSDRIVVERDLASGTEKKLFSGPEVWTAGPTSMLSRDGKWIVVANLESGTRTATLLLVPTEGGPPRELIRAESRKRVGLLSWTPDGSAILAVVATALSAGVTFPATETEVWRVPLDGGERRKIDLNVAGMTPFSVHPDGRQIAFAQTEPVKDDEIWVLENFLPTATARKK